MLVMSDINCIISSQPCAIPCIAHISHAGANTSRSITALMVNIRSLKHKHIRSLECCVLYKGSSRWPAPRLGSADVTNNLYSMSVLDLCCRNARTRGATRATPCSVCLLCCNCCGVPMNQSWALVCCCWGQGWVVAQAVSGVWSVV